MSASEHHDSSNQKGPGGSAHGTLGQYKLGLVLSIVLTLIPFLTIWLSPEGATFLIPVILVCALAQIFVQLVFFLHMNTSSDTIWNTTSAAFIVIIITIVVLGSIWIMDHLNHNMLMGH